MTTPTNSDPEEKPESKSNWLAIIIVVILIVAALTLYGGYKFFSTNEEDAADESSDSDIVSTLTTEKPEIVTEEPAAPVTASNPCAGNPLTRAYIVRLHTTKAEQGGDQAVLITGSLNGVTDTIGGVVNCSDGSSDLYVFGEDNGYVDKLKISYRTPEEREQNRGKIKAAVEAALSK